MTPEQCQVYLDERLYGFDQDAETEIVVLYGMAYLTRLWAVQARAVGYGASRVKPRDATASYPNHIALGNNDHPRDWGRIGVAPAVAPMMLGPGDAAQSRSVDPLAGNFKTR